MDNKLKFQQLECYKLATDEQKEKLNKEQYFDLDKLPENQLQTEFVEYIYHHSCSTDGTGNHRFLFEIPFTECKGSWGNTERDRSNHHSRSILCRLAKRLGSL